MKTKNYKLYQLTCQNFILKKLIERNQEQDKDVKEEEKIGFPFIVIEFPDKKSNVFIYIDKFR